MKGKTEKTTRQTKRTAGPATRPASKSAYSDMVGKVYQMRNKNYPHRIVRIERIAKNRAFCLNLKTGRAGSIDIPYMLAAYKEISSDAVRADAKSELVAVLMKVYPDVKDDANLYVELLERAIAEHNPGTPARLEAVVIQTTDASGKVKGRQVLRVSKDDRVGIHVIPASQATAEIMEQEASKPLNGNGAITH